MPLWGQFLAISITQIKRFEKRFWLLAQNGQQRVFKVIALSGTKLFK